MRILFVNSFYAPEIGGGAELTLQRLVTEAQIRGHDVEVFTTGETQVTEVVDGALVYRFPIDNTFRKLSRELPGKFRRIRWQWRDRGSKKMADRLSETVGIFRPDIVQFHNLPGITMSAWQVPKAMGIKSIQVLHDLNVICPNSSMFKNGASCARRCTSCHLFRLGSVKGSRALDATVGVSSFVLNKVTAEGYFPKSQKHVIYNAQNLPPAHPLPDGPHTIFGYAGALSPAKGIDWLIDQFDNSYGWLQVAGTGSSSYVNYLKDRAAGKNIVFVGHVNPISFFRGVHVAVVPSIWNEALGGVAIEAGSVGRPVIASTRGGLPEVVRHGESGLLVDPDDNISLGQALKALSHDRVMLRSFAEAAPGVVTKFTNLDRFVNEYENLWSTVMSV